MNTGHPKESRFTNISHHPTNSPFIYRTDVLETLVYELKSKNSYSQVNILNIFITFYQSICLFWQNVKTVEHGNG